MVQRYSESLLVSSGHAGSSGRGVGLGRKWTRRCARERPHGAPARPRASRPRRTQIWTGCRCRRRAIHPPLWLGHLHGKRRGKPVVGWVNMTVEYSRCPTICWGSFGMQESFLFSALTPLSFCFVTFSYDFLVLVSPRCPGSSLMSGHLSPLLIVSPSACWTKGCAYCHDPSMQRVQ